MNHLWSPWRMAYIQGQKTDLGCIFCDAAAVEDGEDNLIVWRGTEAFVILNRYPYTSGHIMVVPFAHQPTLAPLSSTVRAEIMELMTFSLQVLQQVYQPQGFNVGMNIGAAAGAGIVDHVHMHVVPRWGGDTNFMSSVSLTRVLPETLEDTYQRIRQTWNGLKEKQG